MKRLLLFSGLTLVGALGCRTVEVEHEVKPIHITVDVNLRMEQELKDFFGPLDAADPTLNDRSGRR